MNKILVMFIMLFWLHSTVFADYNEDIAYLDGSNQGRVISNFAGSVSLDENTKYSYCEIRWNKASVGKAKYAKVRYYGNSLEIIWMKSCVSHIKRSKY